MEEGGGVSLPLVYMGICAFLYMSNLFGVGGFPEIYAQLGKKVWSVCHG